MSSQRKIAANQANARKSTGPKTANGISRSRFNAVSMGLHAKTRVLPCEDMDAYLELADAFVKDLKPSGAMEASLVDQIVADQWRLRRLERAEHAQMTQEIESQAMHRHYEPKAKAIRDAGPLLDQGFIYNTEARVQMMFEGAKKVAPKNEDLDVVLARSVSNLPDIQLATLIDGRRQSFNRRIGQNLAALKSLQEDRLILIEGSPQDPVSDAPLDISEDPKVVSINREVDKK